MKSALVCALVFLRTTLGLDAQTLLNSGFEDYPISPNSFTYGSGALPTSAIYGAWMFNTQAGLVNGVGTGMSPLAPTEGSQYAFLQIYGGSYGTIQTSTTFNLTAGQTYTVSFEQASRSIAAQGALTYSVTLNDGLGASTVLFSRTTSSGESWSHYTATFTAPATASEYLRFSAITGFTGDDTIFVDNIKVAAVPEPATYAVWTGLAGLAVVAFRRRQDLNGAG